MPGKSPLMGRYGPAVAIALLGLAPNIVLTTAFSFLTPVLVRDLHTSPMVLQLAEGMSNAGYALGAVVAAFLGQHVVQRKLFLGYETVFIVGSVLAAAAPNAAFFFAGRVLQGTSTGFMLVAALPPLVTRFGVSRLPVTVAIVNVGLFGATTLGPVIGGPVAAAGAWRPLLWAVMGLGLLGLVVAALGYPRFDPANPDLALDKAAIVLAVAATFLPFFATSVLMGRSFTAPVFFVPFVVGLLALVVLVVAEYRKREPLMPVRALSTQLPVTGTLVAMIAGAVVVSVVELAQLLLSDVARTPPGSAGLLFWPMPVGLVVAAVLFGVLLRTRYLAVLVDVGLVALAGAAVILFFAESADPDSAVRWATLLLGFGAGATVSPGLFLAAFGVPSKTLGRAFALVELLRSEAAYAVGPIIAFVAQGRADLASGVRLGLVVMIALAGLGLVAALVIPAVSGARLRVPDLESWLKGDEPALPSPTTATHLRPSVQDDAAEPLLPRRRH
ncbi:Major Facilitator Superfamily protein [Modestobacter sp. DSM 44400]|uniref:MFS transporter n=1 Tax=Modestobacter sp. DSM 44400 TaxID=1550230 RepID=UPI000897C503|nr:MFS transporter [Modestobacter sp. DSM 44400]SDY30605.1 Major Facilitator Superfamily protein [Modestobacter sp. DSM 44400]